MLSCVGSAGFLSENVWELVHICVTETTPGNDLFLATPQHIALITLKWIDWTD